MHKVSQLNVFPVKSCGGIELKTAEIVARGIKHDRRWMVVDPKGKFVTMRDLSGLTLIQPTFEFAKSPNDLDYLVLTSVDKNNLIKISMPSDSPINMPIYMESINKRTNAGKRRKIEFWGFPLEAVDEGDECAAFLQKCLNVECRLVRIPEDFVRPLDPSWAPPSIVSTNNKPAQTGFADNYPFLVASEASLEELAKHVPNTTPNFVMRRFRPNIVISGCSPFEEDTWKKIKIGELIFENIKPCSRCRITTVDPTTGIYDSKSEPLNTILKIRMGLPEGPYHVKPANEDPSKKKPTKGFFGQYYVHSNFGTITEGQSVGVLEYLPKNIVFTPIEK